MIENSSKEMYSLVEKFIDQYTEIATDIFLLTLAFLSSFCEKFAVTVTDIVIKTLEDLLSYMWDCISDGISGAIGDTIDYIRDKINLSQNKNVSEFQKNIFTFIDGILLILPIAFAENPIISIIILIVASLWNIVEESIIKIDEGRVFRNFGYVRG